MEKIDFPTPNSFEELAAEVTCLKAMLTLSLKAIGLADGGRVVLEMEKLVETHEDETEAEVFRRTLETIRKAYR